MKQNRRAFIVGGLIIAILAILFAWPRGNDSDKGFLAQLKSAGIECLSSHSNVLQHFHPQLSITVDGASELIPANVGIVGNCMSEIHTHDATGIVHVETLSAHKTVYLKDFFIVWGKTIEREGYSVAMMVEGQPSGELGNLLLKDKQQILLEYKKI